MNGLAVPVTRVEVELTEACDLRCAFCYNSREPVYSARVFDVLDALAAARVMEIVLTGGEPSMHPEFLRIVDAAISRFPRVMVQSNGVRFADGLILAELARRGVFCVNFSLHGPRDVHDALTRTPGSFDCTVSALRAAVGQGIRTASNLVLTSANADPGCLGAVATVLHDVGAREMIVTRFVPCGLGQEARSLTLTAERFHAALAALMVETSRRKMSLLLANSAPACKMPNQLQPLVNRCSFGFDKFYVDVRGDILVCGMARRRIGNILEAPLNELLSSSPLCGSYRELRHLPEACRSCADLGECGGGCRAAAMAFGGSFEGMDVLAFDCA